ncbi:hypothetical protein H4582DRAFT_1922728 [Lactarius indigo]|nr:hypothetical protein H4582DRAFT_1922728 [Lactarius indigo]
MRNGSLMTFVTRILLITEMILAEALGVDEYLDWLDRMSLYHVQMVHENHGPSASRHRDRRTLARQTWIVFLRVISLGLLLYHSKSTLRCKYEAGNAKLARPVNITVSVCI